MEHKPITILNTDNEDEDLKLLDAFIEGITGEPVVFDESSPPAPLPAVPGATPCIPRGPSGAHG